MTQILPLLSCYDSRKDTFINRQHFPRMQNHPPYHADVDLFAVEYHSFCALNTN